jgi:hypothetical protein
MFHSKTKKSVGLANVVCNVVLENERKATTYQHLENILESDWFAEPLEDVRMRVDSFHLSRAVVAILPLVIDHNSRWEMVNNLKRGAIFEEASVGIEVWLPEIDNNAVNHTGLKKLEHVVLLEVTKSRKSKNIFLEHHHADFGWIVGALKKFFCLLQQSCLQSVSS